MSYKEDTEMAYKMKGQTATFPNISNKETTIREILTVVYEALEEKGYNPVSQIVGYILSEDPTYITSHRNARALISKLDRDDILDSLAKYYFLDLEGSKK